MCEGELFSLGLPMTDNARFIGLKED